MPMGFKAHLVKYLWLQSMRAASGLGFKNRVWYRAKSEDAWHSTRLVQMGALELIAVRWWLQWCCAITIITIIAIIAIIAWTSSQLCQLVYLGPRHFLAVHFGMQAVRRTWSSCPKCYSRCLHELLPVGTYAILGDHTWLFPVCWSRRRQPNGQCLQQHGDFTISKFQSYGLKYLIFAPPLKMCEKLSICKALRFQFGTCRWGDLKIKAPFVYRASIRIGRVHWLPRFVQVQLAIPEFLISTDPGKRFPEKKRFAKSVCVAKRFPGTKKQSICTQGIFDDYFSSCHLVGYGQIFFTLEEKRLGVVQSLFHHWSAVHVLPTAFRCWYTLKRTVWPLKNGWFENKEPFPFGAYLAYFQGLNLLLVSGKVYADSYTPEI